MMEKEEAAFDNLTQNNDTINNIKIDDSKTVETIKAEKEERITKNEKQIEKPKGNGGIPKKILFGAIGGVVVLSAIMIGCIAYFTRSPNIQNDDLVEMQEQAQIQEQDQQSDQQDPTARQLDNQNLNADANTNIENQSVTSDDQVGAEIGGKFVFDSDGNIAGATKKEADKKKDHLSAEEILANKDIQTYTEDELKSAWTIVDVELTNITATQAALSNRMKELGIEPPYSQLEARQAIHDKALIEEITTRLSEKMNQNMLSLNKKMDDLNKSQIVLSRDVANSLADVMRRIDVEELNNQKDKKGLEELSKANAALLDKYQIKNMASGRVWIIDPKTNKSNSYTINDNIGDDIVINEIDLSNYKIITNKGEIKYNFK